jgi:excinuclease ABC subunit C
MRSVLDTIPGIGRKRKKILLNHFRSIKRIRAATVEELSAVHGISQKCAEAVADRLGSQEAPKQ